MILSFLYNLIKVLLIIILPFCLLIRGAVYLHYTEGFPTMLALGFSTLVTALLLVLYFYTVYGWLSKSRQNFNYLRRRFAIAIVAVGAFVFYGVAYIPAANAKTSDVKKEFYSINPILRLGASTLFFLDKKAIITDASRQPEDYKKMGLKTAKNSLHYKQKDGYAYALDLRTRDRSEIRNTALIWYFRLMGFRTLRHVGTADHLHVSMPCRFRKGAR